MASGGQRQLGRSSQTRRPELDGEDGNLSDEQQEETRNALFGYVFRRAEGDSNLSREQTASFQRARALRLQSSSTSSHTNAESVGLRLAELGDQIDAIYGDELTEIVQLAGGSEQAFQSFHSVVWSVFERDENGFPIINIGRIAAVLGYCYRLCKNYIQQHLNSTDLLAFLGVVAGFLVRFLFEAKFYEWLNRQGGWGNLLSHTTSGLINSGTSVVIFLGFTVVAALLYFRNR